MVPPMHVPIHVRQGVPCQGPHARVLKEHPHIIHARLEGLYQVPHAHFPQEGRRNMGARWEEVWWEDNVNFPQDNVCDDSYVDKCG